DDRVRKLALRRDVLLEIGLAFLHLCNDRFWGVAPSFNITFDLPGSLDIRIWVHVELEVDQVPQLLGDERMQSLEDQNLCGAEGYRGTKLPGIMVVDRFCDRPARLQGLEVLFQQVEPVRFRDE